MIARHFEGERLIATAEDQQIDFDKTDMNARTWFLSAKASAATQTAPSFGPASQIPRNIPQ